MKTTVARKVDKDGYLILPEEFTANKFFFRQVLRKGDFAIYAKREKDWEHETYEVIKILRHNGYSIAGNDFPPAETYPSNEQWGLHGFTSSDYESALLRLEKLIKENQARKDKKSLQESKKH